LTAALADKGTAAIIGEAEGGLVLAATGIVMETEGDGGT
jgi:hypothetical protein